jgi:hypothetical protein
MRVTEFRSPFRQTLLAVEDLHQRPAVPLVPAAPDPTCRLKVLQHRGDRASVAPEFLRQAPAADLT